MGPLEGLRVIELASMGPGPWCAMMLSDMGADVVRIDKPPSLRDGPEEDPAFEIGYLRGRRSAVLDLRDPAGVEALLCMVERADVLLEGYRPGVTERLGIGPEACHERNPRLVYGRMTGWGQEGPLAQAPGHDLNFLALTGLLDAIGPQERPVPPLNLVADYGGGGMLLAFGVVCAVLESRTSGRGQVIDAAMVDGAALVGSLFYGLQQTGRWGAGRGSNSLDGGLPFYRLYQTADDRWLSVAASEPEFFDELVAALGIPRDELGEQHDSAGWPAMAERFARVFRTRTRDEWADVLQDVQACVTPVLTLAEAPLHGHSVERSAFVEVDGVLQPAPAPRFDRTPGGVARGASRPGEHTREALLEWGISEQVVAGLIEDGVAL